MGMDKWLSCRDGSRKGQIEMIHITQVKLPLERVLAKENKEFIKHGIIGEEEKRLVKEAAASIIRLSIQEMKENTILRK